MSKFYDALVNTEDGRKTCIKNLNEQGITTPENATLHQVAANIQLGVNGVNMWDTNYQLIDKEWKKAVKTIPQLDTSKVTSMYQMFQYCSSLTTIPQLDTSQVTNMGAMFQSCSSLTTIPQLDTSQVTNMYGMFNGCSSLTTIPQLDTSQVTSMYSMFYSCTSLTTIPQLDTSNVAQAYYMFRECYSLISIPPMNVGKIEDMDDMFRNCSSLKEIDISLAPIKSNCAMNETFSGIPADCLIKVYDEASKQKVLSSRSDLTNVVVTGGK